MQSLFSKGGTLLLGLLAVLVFVGGFGLCQWAKGEARPHVPGPLQSLVSGERDWEVRDYLDSVMMAFEQFNESAEECAITKDQPCLTRAVKDLRRQMGDAVPLSASWISGAHQDLIEAVDSMVAVHERAEHERRSRSLLEDISKASGDLEAALKEWFKQADR